MSVDITAFKMVVANRDTEIAFLNVKLRQLEAQVKVAEELVGFLEGNGYDTRSHGILERIAEFRNAGKGGRYE